MVVGGLRVCESETAGIRENAGIQRPLSDAAFSKLAQITEENRCILRGDD